MQVTREREREQAELKLILIKITILSQERLKLTKLISFILQKTGISQNIKELLQTLPTPPKHGWDRVKLKQVAFYPQDRIDIDLLTPQNYVGVDNLLQNKEGKKEAEFILEGVGTTNAYDTNDILIGNIRPYLKKIWFANSKGGTNNDVVVVRSKDIKKLNSKFLYCVLCDDDFFEYEMRNAKGVKMPRGDKEAILNYDFPLPPLETQEKILQSIELVEQQSDFIKSKLEFLEKEKEKILHKYLFS